VVDEQADRGVRAHVRDTAQRRRRLRLRVDRGHDRGAVEREAHGDEMGAMLPVDRREPRDPCAREPRAHLVVVHGREDTVGRMIPGLLLTGGASTRMGRAKAELAWDGERLADRVARVVGAVCAPVLEVGPGHSALPAVLEDPPVSDPLLTLLRDHPGDRSVVPVASGRAQPLCARYSADACRLAIALTEAGERSMRALLDAADVELVPESRWQEVAGADALVDVDTPDDVARWQRPRGG